MTSYTTPKGRAIDVEPFDDDRIVVKWNELNVDHILVMKRGLSLADIDTECDKYIYGYTDPDTGEHVPGYADMIKETTTSDSTPLVAE